MANLKPLRALRYTERAGDMGDLVAPPYDVISSEIRQELASRNSHNAVHLTVPAAEADDKSQFIKYARSAALLADWRRDGVIELDRGPALYRYRQSFINPADQTAQTRTTLIGLIEVEPYERGVVLPHEQTFPKYKADRLRVLEATQSHLECIFGLYRDDEGRTGGLLDTESFVVVASLTTDDGIKHELAQCSSPADCSAITASLEQARVWIADGHHRYETAIQFREQHGSETQDVAGNYMMIALSSMRDPGLILLPTHRIIKQSDISEPELHTRLQAFFNIRKVGNDDLWTEVSTLRADDTRVFGIVLPGQSGVIATMEDPKTALELVPSDSSELLSMLDVTILHEIILKKCFGLESLDSVAYTRDATEAVNSVESGDAAGAVLSNPPTVADMRTIAEGGEKMPQKSTYYYPKLLSGLLFWSLSDYKHP